MEVKLPMKALVRVNWLLSLGIGGSVPLFILTKADLSKAAIFSLMTVVILLLVSFLNIYVLVRLCRHFRLNSASYKKYRYLITYPAGVVIYFSVWPLFAYLADLKWSYADLRLIFTFFGSSALFNTLVIFIHDFFILQQEKSQADMELLTLKTAHAEAANLLLRQQIQPHFLFNALNTMKALYRKSQAAGDTYMMHLANFLRASVSNHSTKVSKLNQEIAVLQDYLEMQKIRFGSALDYIIDIEQDTAINSYLPSFSLQPLVENAIKHNELTELIPLSILIRQEGEHIIVSNNIRKKVTRELSTRNGLANLSQRYKLLSGDEVIISDGPEVFSVHIKLLTNEYSDYRG